MNKIPIKMIVLDLDGTLLNDNKVITERNKQALAKLKKQGVKIVFASGRTNFMMSLFQEPYVVCDYHLSFNGGMAEDLFTNEVMYQVTIEQAVTKEIWQYLADNLSAYTAYSQEMMYFYDQTKSIVRNKLSEYINLAASEQVNISPTFTELSYGEIESKPNVDILKFVAYEEEPGRIAQFREFLTEYQQVKAEATGYGITGIFDRHVSKGAAVVKLRNLLKIEKDEVCVIGDYDNDISMFNEAGLKVAMVNGTECLKAHADYVCPDNNHDGIAHFIEEYLID
ncbi:MAG: HAD family phosphatase [Clostridiaceae bacterium]|nr:HAD family phosphatase [Clostridiaceae bacterium]